MEQETSQPTGTISEAASVFEGILSEDSNAFDQQKSGSDNEEEISQEANEENGHEEVQSQAEKADAENEEDGQEELLTEEAESTEQAETEEIEPIDEIATWQAEMQDSLADNPDILDELTIKIEANGEVQEVKVSDLKKVAGLEVATRHKSEALSDERKELSAAREAQQTAIVERLQKFDAFNQALEKQLIGDQESVNWEELRTYDPAEFAAKKQEFQEKQGHLATMQKQAALEAQNARNEFMQTQGAECIENLVQSVPEWQDSKARTTGLKTLRSTMLDDYGISQQMVDNIVDPGVILMARDALAYRQGKAVIEKKVPKKTPLPKFTKPGKKQTKQSTKTRSMKKRAALRKTGTLKAAQQVFMDMA